MPIRHDLEATPTPDERAPLLAHANERHGSNTSENDGSSPEERQTRSEKWQYAWKGFWIVFAILVIAVFVKGWIDADDVNVSDMTP